MNGGIAGYAGALVAWALLSVTAIAAEVTGSARLIDGDTLELDGTIVRLHGIDAPESGQRCERSDGRGYDCGETALDGLRKLTAGQTVSCEGKSTDQYGRLIAICRAQGHELNREMVRLGLAMAFRRYSDDYLEAEIDAFKAGRGLWQGRFDPPWEVRKAAWDSAAREAPEGCPIKGNISSRGRIYHLPYSRHYARTRINTAKGERWFCTEAEAIAAGWRAPYR